MLSKTLRKQKTNFAGYWLSPADTLLDELIQANDEGLDVPDELKAQAERIHASVETDREKRAVKLMERIQCLSIKPHYPYTEPGEVEAILALGEALPPKAVLPDETVLYNRIYGALLGRCAGCLLGQPVEGFMRDRIKGFLKETDNDPICRYMSSEVSPGIRERYGIFDEAFVYGSLRVNWINNVSCMPEDDDTNYTILGLKLMEDYGKDFTSADVAECWLLEVPFLHTCVSERIAYRNFVNGLRPPESGRYLNAYRETVGAQIRADGFGYASYGDPAAAARMAFRDAQATHTKNGIYGEMWVASMLAAVPFAPSTEDAVRFGLGVIPRTSRLYDCVSNVVSMYDRGKTAVECVEAIHARFSEKASCIWFHELPNAMVVAYALLYGAGDFGRTIGLAVEAGFDTDCNGATAGSILGIRLGADKLPKSWTEPLNGKVFTTVAGYGLLGINDLARRFVRLNVSSPLQL